MFSNPRSILITGASSGIGAALARLYAAPDINLFISGRDQERLDEIARECREAGAAVSAWVGDVADEEGLRQWIYSCDDDCPLNLVIANAGIARDTIAAKELHRSAVEQFRVNVGGVFNTVHPALEIMSARQPHPVTNAQVAIVSSTIGYFGSASMPAYSASKAAVKHYGEALRGTFRKTGIGVSVICPGYVSTPMTSANTSSMPFLMSAEKAAAIIASGLAQNKARITFPWQFTLLLRLVINLPAFLFDRINKPGNGPRLEQ